MQHDPEVPRASQWVRNLRTGLAWEVDAIRAARLLGQRDISGKPEYEDATLTRIEQKLEQKEGSSHAESHDGGADHAHPQPHKRPKPTR